MPLLVNAFAGITDPRTPYLIRHRLDELLVITLCAVICRADSLVAVEQFARAKQDWLTQRLGLTAGAPSHDTIGRVLALIDPAQFACCFAAWMADVHERTAGEVDGKTLRRSYDRAAGIAPVQMVTAFACANGLVLGQAAVEGGAHESTALPALLDLLDLSGCLVTYDAAGCYTDTAQHILDRGGDYVLALEGNQPTLHDEVTTLFERYDRDPAWRRRLGGRASTAEQTDGGHGRVEVRRAVVLDVDSAGLLDAPGWPLLRSVVRVESERHIGSDVSCELRYYVTSVPATGHAARLLSAVRSHWRVENSVHWTLDVSFSEDASRVRSGHAAANLASVRRLALSALRRESSLKVGVETKRSRAGWDERYLERVLSEIGSMR